MGTAVGIIWAGVIPGLMALMMYAALFMKDIVPATFLLIIVVSVSMLAPAKKMHDERFKEWGDQVRSINLIASLGGMLYIALIGLFSVTMISMHQGHEVGLGIIVTMGALLGSLISVMLYGLYRKRGMASKQRRFFNKKSRVVESRFRDWLHRANITYRTTRKGMGTRIDLPDWQMSVLFNPLSENTSEVVIDNFGRDAAIERSVKAVLGDRR